VVSAGQQIMLIVPAADKLIVEAKVQPQDIDQLSIGQAAVMRTAHRITHGHLLFGPDVTAAWTDAQAVDVLRLHLGLDDQLVGRRHDQHDLLARRNHAADRVTSAGAPCRSAGRGYRCA